MWWVNLISWHLQLQIFNENHFRLVSTYKITKCENLLTFSDFMMLTFYVHTLLMDLVFILGLIGTTCFGIPTFKLFSPFNLFIDLYHSLTDILILRLLLFIKNDISDKNRIILVFRAKKQIFNRWDHSFRRLWTKELLIL